MSKEYDSYLQQHRSNVQRGLIWLITNLPRLFYGFTEIIFEHDQSKNEPDEYEAYDAYFYGERTPEVEEAFNRAWLLHIHRNPHHWQYWVLNNDDPDEGEICIEMPYNYIIEMICDWWAFSWQKGNLSEIFNWYDEHSAYIKLAPKTRETVEDILWELRGRLGYNVLAHHGIKGQKWGVRNGPPYPLEKSRKSGKIVLDAIEAGEISKTINKEKQKRHTLSDHLPGRSYLKGDLDFAQELINKLSGTGEPIKDVKGNWTHRERVTNSDTVGTHVDNSSGKETKTKKAIITYSKSGSHVYPAKERKDKNET